MVATVLLSMIILGILSVLIGSYRVAAKARYNDHARYIIKSLSDQFLTQQSTDTSGNNLAMFQTTVDPNPGPNMGLFHSLGTGIKWPDSSGHFADPSSDSYTYPVVLGDNTGVPINATVTRSVWYLTPASGGQTLAPQNASAGYMLEGDFTITYPLFGKQVSQTITNVRSIP